MTLEERLQNTIHNGNVVKCSKEEYPKVREILHNVASRYIDNGESVRASIALNEIKRLDEKFGKEAKT